MLYKCSINAYNCISKRRFIPWFVDLISSRTYHNRNITLPGRKWIIISTKTAIKPEKNQKEIDISPLSDIIGSSENTCGNLVTPLRCVQWHLACIFTAALTENWQAIVYATLCLYLIPQCLPEKETFMGYTNKPFEELDVLDNFLMNAIATDEEVGEAFCRKVLSVLLQRTDTDLPDSHSLPYPPAVPQRQSGFHPERIQGC